MVRYKVVDIFESHSRCIVNPVNCMGVMGAGLALQFKERFPSNFQYYKKICDQKLLYPGDVLLVEVDSINHCYIANIATKDHWKIPSRIEYVELGLNNLLRLLITYNIDSVSIPPVGAGLGGLDWATVRSMIVSTFMPVDTINTTIVLPPSEYG